MINLFYRLYMFVSKYGCFFILFFSLYSYSQSTNTARKYSYYVKEWKNSSFEELASFFKETNKEQNLMEIQVVSDLMFKKALKEKKPYLFVKVYCFLSKAYKNSGDYTQSLHNINKAIGHLQKHPNNQDKAVVYLLKAEVLYDLGDYKKALINNLLAQNIARKNNDKHIQINVNNNIASIKYEMNDIQGALDIYLKNLLIFKAIGVDKLNKNDQFSYIKNLIAIAKGYTAVDNFGEARIYCLEIIKFSEQYDYHQYKAYGYLGLGNLYSLNCRVSCALKNLEKAERTSLYITNSNFRALVHFYKARVLFAQKYYIGTIEELSKTEHISGNQILSARDFHEMNVLYAKSYQKLHDLERASQYSNRAFDLFETNKKKMGIVNTSLTRDYDTEELKEEIAIWSSRTKKQKRKFHYSIIVAILLLTSFTVFYQKKIKKNKKRFDALIVKLNQGNENLKLPRSHKKQFQAFKINDEKINELLEKLKVFEKEEGYLNNQLTLNEVAKKLETNTNYLSKVINLYLGQSFTKYLTELRLDYAMNRLKNDSKLRSYTIKSIAQESGFNSPEPFAKAFKKKAGIYPSYFIKQLEMKRTIK